MYIQAKGIAQAKLQKKGKSNDKIYSKRIS